MSEFNITLFEACEFLNKSKKTISRYVRQGKLAPQKVKSQQGTLEYRFSRSDLEALRSSLPPETKLDRPDRGDRTEETGHEGQRRQDINKPLEAEPASSTQEKTVILDQTGKTRQDTGDRPDRTRETDQTGQDTGIIDILKETTELLKAQLTIKDGQINQLNTQMGQLIERDRETNILLKGLQDKLVLLEPPKREFIETIGKAGQDIKTPKSRGELVKQIILSALLLITMWLYFRATHSQH